MLIRVDNVSFTYPGDVKALVDVSMTIQPGEMVALVGENGSGKTTLARHLNGLLQPGSGSVWIGDWQTTGYSSAKLARRVAYAFQNPDEQLFRQRVWDEVAFGPQNLGYDPSKVKGLVEQALGWMELGEEADFNPRDLGFAGRKRVSLAAALAMDTPVMVFDEPTAGLDASELELLAKVLKSLRKEKTVLVISHDMDFLAENLDRIVLLDEGRLIADAPAQEFFYHTHPIDSAFIHSPQIVRLSHSLGQAGLALKVDQFLQNLKQMV